MAVIRGTDKNNKLKGKATDDRIYGLFGNDLLDGGAGDDILHGHGGNDKFLGGLGNDQLDGGDGRDNLSGGEGDDYLSGGFGVFADILRGGIGNDALHGNDGNDSLSGDAGNDSLFGGDGVDKLIGGDGNDYLDGGSDEVRDVLTAGAGNDRVVVHGLDVATGGSGSDTLALSRGVPVIPNVEPTPLNVNLSKITGKKAADVGLFGLKAGQFERAEIYLYGAVKGSTFVGSKGDDVLSIYSNWDGGITINGGKGDDTLSSSGNNVLIGGAGSDTFVLNSYYGDADTIQDFTAKDFLLVGQSFYNAARDNVDLFNPLVIGSDPVANSAKAQFLYDIDDGRLFYDPDGTGIEEPAFHLVTLASRPNLKVSNFLFDL
ncbi:calcium-binding protein [Microvirga brassicacearum]|uniref:Calcium-binding protein n=1 Tax=Microvirga brassicacearum TaxID=2580413 RepID=A0A5N3P7W6_9HYPH|nr:calcium-binding protein [Microvirga brassicacearum]KAB0265775.1 calcium-binding protein [Microvirga brassicacearum]